MVEQYRGYRQVYLLAKRKKKDVHYSSYFLFTGVPRMAGKSLAGERVIQSYIESGAKVIAIADQKDDVELAYMSFPAQAEYHLAKLHNQNEQPKGYDVRVNHPFTLDIPNKDEAECNYFTMSIKSGLYDNEIKYILESKEEDSYFNLIKSAVADLKNTEGIYQLMQNVDRKIKRKMLKVGKEEIAMPDEDMFMVEGTSSGNRQVRDEIVLNFKNMFSHHFFMMPENYKRNLDMRKILKDTSKIDVFTTRHIKGERKVKDFITFWLMNEIARNKDFIPKKGLLIVLQEIKDLCPKRPSGYEEIFVDTFRDMLTLHGSARISVIADTQSMYMTNGAVIGLFNEIFWGKTLSSTDLKEIYANYKMPRETVNLLQMLDRGEFIPNRYARMGGRYAFFLPTFMHHEEGLHFDQVFEEHFPERMHNYYDFVKEIRKYNNEEREKVKAVIDEKIRKRKEEIQAEMKEKRKSEEMEEEVVKLKKEKADLTKTGKEARNQYIVEMKLKYPKFGNRKIADRLLEEKGIKVSWMTVNNVLKKNANKGEEEFREKVAEEDIKKKEDFLKKNLGKPKE